MARDDGRPILSDLSLVVQRGERVALVGAVGSGKSTVLRILAGFCSPQDGDAFLGGRWYAGLQRASIRAEVGYVPQTPVLFRGTVLQNVIEAPITVKGMTREAMLERHLQIYNR